MQVLASFDDGTVEDLKLADLLDKYDIYTTFYWPSAPTMVNELAGRRSLNKQQRKDISERFEIGSHTITHPLLTRVPLSIADYEIRESKSQLEEEFDINVTTFSYPRGYSNHELQKIVEDAGYYNARGVTVGYIHGSENPYYTNTTVHVGYDRKEYAGKTWLEYAYAMLEEAIDTPDSVYHLFGHSWELSKYDGWHDLEKLLKRINENQHS